MSVAGICLTFPTLFALSMSVAVAMDGPPDFNSDVQLTALGVPKDSLKTSEKSKNKTTHISIVLVGDTGYAPHGVRPNAKGVAKHGYWQTWDQTTRRIKSQIDGDINFANIETVISSNGRLRRRPKAYNFMMHPNGARHLVDVGFNLFSMANNHSFDFGAGGIRDSIRHADSLKANGLLAHAGIGLNQSQAAHVPTFSRKDTRFAFGALGIGATYGGLPRASNTRPGQLGINKKNDVKLLMNNLRKADADYRMLSLHRGYEKIIRVDGSEISAIHKTMLDQGNVDLLIGHHAHVTRGVEINNGRLIFYGLGNFLHQGTANMASKGRCKDYSIVAKVHLVRDGDAKPELAAVEVVPITGTHRQTRVMKPRQGAKRVAILNGLARQFDSPARGAKGVRFSIRGDGTGLYCTPAAAANKTTASMCLDYDPAQVSRARVFRAALASCGRSYSPILVARRTQPKVKEIIKTTRPVVRPKLQLASVSAQVSEPVVQTGPIVDPVLTSFPVAKGKPVYDAGLLRPALSLMTKAQVKAYWTLVWYTRKGRTPPPELARMAILRKQAKPIAVADLAIAWKALQSGKNNKSELQPKPATKVALLTAWNALKPTTVQKSEEPKVNKASVELPDLLEDKKTAPTTKRSVESKPQHKIVYDSGLRRPDFRAMTEKQINAYWTRVWYARRDLRRKRKLAPTS